MLKALILGHDKKTVLILIAQIFTIHCKGQKKFFRIFQIGRRFSRGSLQQFSSIEIEGSDRPGCVIDTISRYTFHSTAAAVS